MEEEIRTIFEDAMEADALAAAQARIAALEAEKAAERDKAAVDIAVHRAVEDSGTVDPEIMELLLRQAELTAENGRVAGLEDAVEAIRRGRPWLFRDGGARPTFAAAVREKEEDEEEETVARRYRNNPWYKRR